MPHRRKMQVVFQDPYGSFDPRHNVERLVSEPLHLLEKKPSAGERREMVRHALHEVGLQADAWTNIRMSFPAVSANDCRLRVR
jgi:ABC-type microcin C transport system duplicated ATPase subunit YejF